MKKYRCLWAGGHPDMIRYHDRVWGRPKHKDQDIFRAIVLDAFQAGLSWQTILLKQENFARAFHDFDPKKVADMTAKDIARLKKDQGIIRHQGKIRAAINNAQNFLKVQKEYGTFAKHIWSYTDGQVIMNHPKHPKDMHAHTPLSTKISQDLRKRGFNFVGPTMVHALMQGIGLVNDHEAKCAF